MLLPYLTTLVNIEYAHRVYPISISKRYLHYETEWYDVM